MFLQWEGGALLPSLCGSGVFLSILYEGQYSDM